jgi:hypothetical protein
VVGGTQANGVNFDKPDAVDVLDINKLEWTGKYDPTKYAEYEPADIIVSGNVRNNWPDNIDRDLLRVLNTTYDPDHTKLQKYWPYTTSAAPAATSLAPPPNDDNKWVTPVAAVLGVVGGLALVGLLLFFCVIRPRRNKNKLSEKRHSNATTDIDQEQGRNGRIKRWLGGTAAAPSTSGAKDIASDIFTETDGAVSPPPLARSETTQTNNPSELDNGYFRSGGAHLGRPPIYGGPGPHEIDSTRIHEVHGSLGNIHDVDIRQFSGYPASVLSANAGHHSVSATGGAADSDSVSQPTTTNIPPHGHPSPTASAASPSPRPSPVPMPAPLTTIPQTAATFVRKPVSPDFSGGSPTNRAVSPLMSEGESATFPRLGRQDRPGHRRNASSMSSGLSPLPSPGSPPSRDEDEGGGRGATI